MWSGKFGSYSSNFRRVLIFCRLDFHHLSRFIKKGIVVKFKQAFAFRNYIPVFLSCSGLLAIVLLMHLNSAP